MPGDIVLSSAAFKAALALSFLLGAVVGCQGRYLYVELLRQRKRRLQRLLADTNSKLNSLETSS